LLVAEVVDSILAVVAERVVLKLAQKLLLKEFNTPYQLVAEVLVHHRVALLELLVQILL
jgi:hypothetical protein